MIPWLSNIAAVARLTLLDVTRQRLWLLFVLAATVLVCLVPYLSAVDDSARFKLAVVAMTGAVTFVVVLLAVLVGAASLRRDLDARIGFLLFAKPLRVSAYLSGRWMGVQIGLLLGMAALGAIAAFILAIQFNGLPRMRAVDRPVSWQQIGTFGQEIAINEHRSRVHLSGAPGNGIRWQFTGLPTNHPDGLEVLIRVSMRGFLISEPVLDTVAQITAIGAAGSEPRILTLDPASPYGHTRAGAPLQPGQVVLRDRDESRDDLAQDYLRVRLPNDIIAADGSVSIQLTRLEARAGLSIARDSSALIAVDGGSFIGNLTRGLLIILAGAGVLTACTIAIASIANLGVATLGGLTLFFAGSATPMMGELVMSEHTAPTVRRLIELLLTVTPNFERYTIAARLASHESITWAMVGSAWLYYGIFIIVLLSVAWIAMRRREL